MTSRTAAEAIRSASSTGASRAARAEPPITAAAAYAPSTVAMPSAAADPTRQDVRALSVTRNAPTAPIGIAMAQPVTRPDSTTSSTR